MPVQRIPRYRMLLQELQKRTPPNHVDYAAIEVALGEVNKVAQYVNESKRKEENNVIVFHVQDLLGSRFQILPHRHYIRRSCMTVKCSKINHLTGNTQFDMFLFNDMILILPKGVVPQFNSPNDNVENKPTLSQKEIVNQCVIIYLCFANLKEREVENNASSNSLVSEVQKPTDFKLHMTGFFNESSFKFEFITSSELELAEWEADISINISRIHKIFLRRGVDPTVEHLEKTRLKLKKTVFVGEGHREQKLLRREQHEEQCKVMEKEMQQCEDKYTELMKQIDGIKKKHTEVMQKINEIGDQIVEIAASLEDDRSKLGETDEVIWSILNHDMHAFNELFGDKPNVPPEQLDGAIVKSPEQDKKTSKQDKKEEDEDQSAMALYFRDAQAKFTVADILKPVDRDVPEDDVEIENVLFQLRTPSSWIDIEQELIPHKYRSERISNNNKLATHQKGWNVTPEEGDPMQVIQKYLNEDLYSDTREEHIKKQKDREAKKVRDEEEKRNKIEELKSIVEQNKVRKGLTSSVGEDVEELRRTIHQLQKENEELRAKLNQQN
jgi:predicted  nucleic acid-binding Zn-ribbon protein